MFFMTGISIFPLISRLPGGGKGFYSSLGEIWVEKYPIGQYKNDPSKTFIQSLIQTFIQLQKCFRPFSVKPRQISMDLIWYFISTTSKSWQEVNMKYG